MKFPVIKAPILVNIVIAVISIAISGFTLLFGIAHIFEGRNPDIPNSEHLLGVTMVVGLCVLGIVFLVITIAAIKGIIFKLKQN
jgi:hypothetical protein